MLAYTHINLLSMLQRFKPGEIVQVATDSIYVRKTALYKLEGIRAYKPPEGYCSICLTYHDKATSRPPRDGIVPAQWRDKGESLYMLMEHAAYLAGPDYKATKKDLPPSSAPRQPPIPTPALLPLQRRGQRQNHASDGALPYQKPPRLHPDPSPGQRDESPGGSGPRPITASSVTLAPNMLGQSKKISSFSRASLNTSGRL